jgi:ArsR family transcriptional regulator
MAVDVKADGVLEAQLRALADPARRRIVELLRRRGLCSCELVGGADPGLCVCDLEKELGLSQPTVTHHIQVLREAGLITARKIGRWLYCRRNEEALDRLADSLRKL